MLIKNNMISYLTNNMPNIAHISYFLTSNMQYIAYCIDTNITYMLYLPVLLVINGGGNLKDLNDLKLKQVSIAVNEGRPIPVEKLGQWIRDVREALGMTQKQLSKRLHLAQSSLSRIEENAKSCTINTLAKIATGLQCEFMGVLISKDGLENIIKLRAEIKAKEILKQTFANMAMEKQMPDNNAYIYQLKKLTEELTNNPGPNLWEE
ncbi:hypothetical protein A3K48_01770 [candidate division WOR-1 bacterium RIFOXYA12_FULL_52_29]|uniref:HTH cro/C1-type domain-containing protein n=1 Tax=candidate division WOR-1 bacterium RIFOXYC12_FULL_54_18 TaxID=1802584 RepID=A0A1F4T5A9_UNCSA|nr:MAG: hypothetical protein A3K44_01770 [candidate division WOR-1 bacterium RIFOXYA2_FULL_51_19]OGC17310.1 MAG: hypothetical protein A3K48_01770 [candidate division WOR-1 bacterium RIFOXYA12_FULL_52_29]OGC26170.1 MAG: hypothetical protein A3K32_01765 [candidate division WOR-1 bacterium RIFOXYB2_FULL_45_9]OGC27727.1 MAG: hypothetical protein A3K49_01770 [candidate division WOR-1 bacterium RIFOXYC12_FULL_54_18]OGC29982.1 MAG: hypothetical protein A2346_04565 [candidate division WOR-1 bacterium R